MYECFSIVIYSAASISLYLKETANCFAGQEEIFQIAIHNRKDLERKRRKLAVLESELVASGYKTEDLLRDGKKLSAESTLKILRTRMVHIYLNMQHLQLEIARLEGKIKGRYIIWLALLTFWALIYS